LADQVHELQGLDKERRELQARDAPPEVIPVMAVSIFRLSISISANLSLPEKPFRERSPSIPTQHLMEPVSQFPIFAKTSKRSQRLPSQSTDNEISSTPLMTPHKPNLKMHPE
jgi:hypothetical protein